jgi:hypothetical protein
MHADSTTHHYTLDIAMHCWFRDMFFFHMRFEEKAGQALPQIIMENKRMILNVKVFKTSGIPEFLFKI